MIQLKIDALDTVFFRDGKPFSLGEETWAEGLFPPYPSVFYGALRSGYFSQFPNELRKANTAEDPTRHLKITRLHFWLDNEPHWICPLDYVQEQEMYDPRNFLLQMESVPKTTITSYPLAYWLTPPTECMVENIDGLLDAYTMEQYLLKNNPHAPIKPWKEYLQTEPKVGIRRDKNTNSTQEGMLYRVGMVRPAYQDTIEDDKINPTERLSVIVAFEGLPHLDQFPATGFLKLGGEGKAVAYEVMSNQHPIPSQLVEGQSIFKLILNTPAIFNKGWLPAWLDFVPERQTYEGQVPLKHNQSAKVTLLAATIGKPISIGGFDMKKKLPKSMYKAVPAGAVYYFRLEDVSQASQVQQALHLNTISEVKASEGFGLTFFTQPPLT